MRKFIAFGPAIVVLITALVTLVAAPAAVRLVGYASTDTKIQLAQQSLDQDTILKQIDKAVRNIADAVEPSVVHIAVEEPTGRGGRWIGPGSAASPAMSRGKAPAAATARAAACRFRARA